MSNRISLTFTQFTDIDKSGNEQSFDYGYRLYDEYASTYNNNFDNLTALNEEVNEENFWKVLDNHDEFSDIDPFETGMYFNGDWYDGEEIQEISEEVERRTAKRCED